MKYRVYTPQSAQLPATAPLKREPLGRRRGLLRRHAPLPADFSQFETHTLVHDIFLTPDAAQVVAIGPPLLNLDADLTPVYLQVKRQGRGGNKTIKARISRRARFSMYCFDMPPDVRHTESLSVQLSFAQRYHFDFVLTRQVCDPVNLQLITLQKNNAVPWIIDWIAYYEHLGVERILLYDNGSTNRVALEQALASQASGIELILIDWPFNYGPATSSRNRFCQSSQNNHAYACFASAQWSAHFDIDEYLVLGQRDTHRGRDVSRSMEPTKTAVDADGLSTLLSQTNRWTGQLRFDSYWVPNAGSTFSDSLSSGIPTVRDFPYRDKVARGKAHKYLVRHKALKYANTHNCRLRPGYRRRHMPADAAVFLHYKALTDEWKALMKSSENGRLRGRTERLDDSQHTLDTRVIDAMQALSDC